MSHDIDAVVRQTQEYYDGPADEIYRRLWRDNIHMGTWESADDTIDVAMDRTNRVMAAHAGITADSRVLDLGSGYGATARFLAAELGCEVVGLNISPRENELAEERIADAGLSDRVTIQYGDFHDLPFADASFDVVWSQEALLHGADKHQIIAECARVLRTGGRVAISDLLVRGELADDERQAIYDRVKSPGMWDAEQYEAALADAGLVGDATLDLAANVAPTYQAVLDQLSEQRDAIASRVPVEQIDATMRSLQLWVDSAQAGKISQGLFIATKPA